MTSRPFTFYRICPEDAHACTKPTCLAQAECAGFAKPPLAAPSPKPTPKEADMWLPDQGDWR